MSSHNSACAPLRNYQSDSRPPYSSFHSTPSGHVPSHQCVPSPISPNNGRKDCYKNQPRHVWQRLGPKLRYNMDTPKLTSNIPTYSSPYNTLPSTRRAPDASNSWPPHIYATDPASSIPRSFNRVVGHERSTRKKMDDYSNHPCRLVRIMGSRILVDASRDKSTTGLSKVFDDTVFYGLPNVTIADSTPELSDESYEASSADQYTAPPSPLIPIVKERELAFSPPLIPIGMKRKRRSIDSPPSLPPPTIVYAQTVVHSPRPQRNYVTAPFLLEEYVSNRPPGSSTTGVRGIPKDREEARMYRDRQEEQTLLNFSLLLSAQDMEPEVPNVPLWPSISPPVLEIPSCEFSSSTSAYHTFFGGVESRSPTLEETDRILARSELAQGSGPLSSAGSRRPTAGFASPLSDETLVTSSSSGGSSANLLTPMTVGQDLQSYTEHMAAQIFKVRGLAEVMSSSWMVAMQAEFLTCQKIMANGG